VWVGSDRDNVVHECDGFTGSVFNSWDAGHDPYGLAALCGGGDGLTGEVHAGSSGRTISAERERRGET
jgi:hypothetical protein